MQITAAAPKTPERRCDRQGLMMFIFWPTVFDP